MEKNLVFYIGNGHRPCIAGKLISHALFSRFNLTSLKKDCDAQSVILWQRGFTPLVSVLLTFKLQNHYVIRVHAIFLQDRSSQFDNIRVAHWVDFAHILKMKFVQNTGAQRNNCLLVAKNAVVFRRIKRRRSDLHRRETGCKSCCPKPDSFLPKIRKGNLILVMLVLIKREKCLKNANKININNQDIIFIGYLKQHNEFVGAVEI